MNIRRSLKRSISTSKAKLMNSKQNNKQIQDLSTFRTKFSKESLLNQSRTNDLTATHLELLQFSIVPQKRTIKSVLNKEYSKLPVSMVYIWSNRQQVTKVQCRFKTKQILEDREQEGNEQEERQWEVIEGRNAVSIVNFSNIESQSIINGLNQLLLEYVIGNVIFIMIKPSDFKIQKQILRLCQMIGDILLFCKQKEKYKPDLILMRINQEGSQELEGKWATFMERLISWKHFNTIQIFDIDQQPNKNRHIQINQVPLYYSFIRQIIRQHQKPQQQTNKIMIGALMSNYISKLQESLDTNLYTNVNQVLYQSIQQNIQFFKLLFKQRFKETTQDRINLLGVIHRFHFYRQLTVSKKLVKQNFKNAQLCVYNQTIKSSINQQLIKFKGTLIKDIHNHNTNLIQILKNKYLQYRPLSLIKCKSMMNDLLKQYINESKLQDIFQFLIYLVSTFGNQLAWGDQLNALNAKNTRIDALTDKTQTDIAGYNDKISALQLRQFARSLSYNTKTIDFKEKLMRKVSVRKMTSLEMHLLQKIDGQRQKMFELKDVMESLSVVQNISALIEGKQIEYLRKQDQIKKLRKELEKLQRLEIKENKIREQEEERRQEEIKNQKLIEEELQKQNQQKQKERRIRERRRSVCGCFGL